MSSIPQERLLLLFDLIAHINSKMDLNRLLTSIMEAAKTMMDAEASSLFLLDAEKQELEISIPTGEASGRITGFRIPMNQGIAGWVATNNEPLLVPDVRVDPRFGGDVPGSGFITRNLLCVPMKNADGKLIGVLQAINHKGEGVFPESEIPLFQRLADQAAISLERERLFHEYMEKQKMEEQLNLARDIQRHLWPRHLPNLPGYSIIGQSKPALEVGGDYYDFIPLDDGKFAFVIGDVSGKGVGAGLIMATLRATLRTQFAQHTDIDRAIQLVNKAVTNDTRPTEFVTMFLAILDPVTHVLTYVNAGHNPPYIVDEDGTLTELNAGGPVVGILHPMIFESRSVEMKPGSVLLLYTDGVTEAENAAGDQFEEAALQAFLKEHISDTIDGIHKNLMNAIEAFQGDADQADDITIIFLKRDR
jgi:sigma-B regulation protein RsbU (phosphoserine phosphatase)